MGREASFELNCSRFSDNILDIIKLLNSFGWTYYDEDHHAEYLPLGDRDNFDWQMGEMTEGDLYAIIDLKQQRCETVGLVMYYRDTDYGITLLAAGTDDISIIPNINRKTLDEDDRDSVTDVSWYAERIIQKLIWYNCEVDSFQFEEYTD
jgi:hypothetical protein